MQRVPAAFIALVFAVAAAGCAGDDAPSSQTRTTSAFDVENAPSTTAVAQAGLCFSESARNVATAYVTAMQPNADVGRVIAGLQQAADVAPEELDDEFRIVLGAQVPFLEILRAANGNLATASRDPAFRSALARTSSPDVVQASATISTWVAVNCRPPR